MRDCYAEIFRAPGLLRAMHSAIESEAITNLSAVAFFLVSVCKGDAEARCNKTVQDIAEILKARARAEKDAATAELANLLNPHGHAVRCPAAPAGRMDMLCIDLLMVMASCCILTFDAHVQESDGPKNLEDARAIQRPPGDRHDNDFADFRRIVLVPTAEEMNCEEEPYLPMSVERSVSHTLERQFRLLREDMVCPA